MALFGNPIVYGLTQENNLEDVVDTFSALNTITLNPYDLGLFAGIGNYLDSNKVHILNNTNENLEITYNRLKNDAAQHQTVLNLGTDIKTINGNLTVYGPVAAKSISYYDLDKFDPNTGFIPQEASTSTTSIWSPTSSTIQFNKDVIITAGTSISAKGLKYINTVKPVKIVNFPLSEPATHTLEISANGKRFQIYLTKDIPYVLPPTGTAYIQDIKIAVSIISATIPLSYIINEVPNDGIVKKLDSKQYYITQDRVIKDITYTKNYSNKNIEIYTSPDNFEILKIPNLQLSELPLIILKRLEALDISSNNFNTIPNLSILTPAVSSLTLDNQVGGLPGNVDSTFISKLPPNLSYLSMGNGAFNSGSIHKFQPYNILSAFPLEALKLGGGRFSDTCPLVSESCTSYDVQSNNFSALPVDGLFRPTANNNITDLNFSGNTSLALSPTTSATYMSGAYYSTRLTTFNILNTKLPIPDLSNKTSLKTFAMDGRNLNSSIIIPASAFSLTNSDGVYKFDGCTSLTDITFTNMASSFAGILPNITSSVVNLTFNNVSFTGTQSSVQEDGSTNIYGLYKNTLIGCSQTLKSFFYTSTYDPGYALNVESGLFNAFNKLKTLTIRTRNLSGTSPELSRCNALEAINIGYNDTAAGGFNKLSPIPFDSFKNLSTINMSYNALSGTLDTYAFFGNGQADFTAFTSLDFNNNYFDNLIISSVIKNLQTINFSFNKLKDIPDFRETPLIKNIDLRGNNISGYTLSAFSKITFSQGSRVIIDLRNNKLSAAAVENIIKDLYTATKNISTIAEFTLNLSEQPAPLNLTGVRTEYSQLTSYGQGQGQSVTIII